MRYVIPGFICLVFLCVLPSAAQSQQIGVENAFPNLSVPFIQPLDLQDPYDGTDRLFVATKRGQIHVFENDSLVTSHSVFLDLRDRVYNQYAAGFQGFAFHPDYENNGYFYVCYNIPDTLIVSRFSVKPANPDSADIDSELILLAMPKSNYYHNGAALVFDDDGYLFISLGEDGIISNAQDRTTLYGSLIRIDVDTTTAGKNYGIPPDNPYVGNGSGYLEEIYAYGFRNPWRFSIDPVTKRIWLGDVGLDNREEVDLVSPGRNYGWPNLEGTYCFSPPVCDTTGYGFKEPLWEYTHSLGNVIIGGHVYRGSRLPGLVGKYICCDMGSGRMWFIDYDGVNPVWTYNFLNFPNVVSFGVDKDNELYMCNFDGHIYRFTGDWPWPVGARPALTEGSMGQNFPNPFNPQTTIEYSVPTPADVVIRVYDVGGRLVRLLVKQAVGAGQHTAHWDGTNDQGFRQASGVYFYSLDVDGRTLESRRMVLLK